MHKSIAVWRVVAVVVATTPLSACGGIPGLFSVQPAGSTAGQPPPFSASEYASSIWATKVVPTFDQKAASVDAVLAAIAKDPAAASKQYGHQESDGGPFAFMVKGSGRVLAVDRSSASGLLMVDLAPYDGRADLGIAIGPAFLGTAIRDAVGFIQFGQFTNQLEYADVATALNDHVRDAVVAKIPLDASSGHMVSFEGAFQLLDPTHIVVTPVRLALDS